MPMRVAYRWPAGRPCSPNSSTVSTIAEAIAMSALIACVLLILCKHLGTDRISAKRVKF